MSSAALDEGPHQLQDGGSAYGGTHIDFLATTSTAIPPTRATGGGKGSRSVTHGPVPRTTASLPPRPLGFTGRSAELERLLPHLAPTDDGTTALPLLIFAVTGMGGIGKTALAVEAAHQARAKGWFPGGTLFVDLRGYDDDPVTADQALLALLDALGVRDRDLPPTTERQYDAYRTLLGERRDRMLLILDNASDPSQYLPLLPGTDHHRVLITSRDRPDALPIRLIDLETLDPDDSVALVTRALLDTDERDERAAQEPDALRELTDLCGHLPLALQIAAGMLRRRRHRDIASLVTEIRDTGDPTTVLDHGHAGTDLYGRSLVLRPVLETSYRRLPPNHARLLRLLCLAPGTDTGTEAIAALADLDTEAVLSLLEDLAATHLVTPVQSINSAASTVRWRVHDLVRAFGAGVAASDAGLREEGEAARERMLGLYCRWAEAADNRLRWLPGMEEPELFADRGQALEWLDSERAELVASVLWARDESERFADMAVRLAECLAEYLAWRRYIDDWITVAQAAREAARRAGNRLGEAMAWDSLGRALREAGRTAEATQAHTRARDLHRTAGDRRGESIAWDNLGNALRETGRTAEAIQAHTRARDLFRAAGDRHREATAWTNLGNALLQAGRTDEAINSSTRARNLHQAAGDRHGEAATWSNLGNALLQAGRTDEATEAYGRALETYTEFEDWYRTGRILENLAHTYEAANRSAEARTAYLQAADAFTRANAPTEAVQARSRADQRI
ncbi:tetratricopeptide repeat protein [Streptomyces xylophagus]|uniref:tetratricopeptide repeat protein n=1 Tax=Streptomyces xylophagus TaxID=285514 RepID=UPI00389A069C